VPDSPVHLDHPYIEEHHLAERFVDGTLSPHDRKLFEQHYVDCQECMDRVALAQIFRADAAKPQAEAAAKETKPAGPFTGLATFPPLQQTLIFAASALVLLLMPIVAMNWMEHHASTPKPAPEAVLWIPQSGPIEARIPASADWVSISTMVPDGRATYRLSIVDVADRPIIVGPDQHVSTGTALGLRLPSLPATVSFVVVEKKAENGAYTLVSRHPLFVQWK
jgi:hypothetical protein